MVGLRTFQKLSTNQVDVALQNAGKIRAKYLQAVGGTAEFMRSCEIDEAYAWCNNPAFLAGLKEAQSVLQSLTEAQRFFMAASSMQDVEAYFKEGDQLKKLA
eukprot:658003-Alexandrium_andersonii.AAC.1